MILFMFTGDDAHSESSRHSSCFKNPVLPSGKDTGMNFFPAFPAACRIQPDTMSDTVSAFLSAEAYTKPCSPV